VDDTEEVHMQVEQARIGDDGRLHVVGWVYLQGKRLRARLVGDRLDLSEGDE
jgi:hypothetical protein